MHLHGVYIQDFILYVPKKFRLQFYVKVKLMHYIFDHCVGTD